MHKGRYKFLPLLAILLIITLVIFISDFIGISNPLSLVLDKMTIPFQNNIYSALHTSNDSSEVVKLKEENLSLQTQLAKLYELQKDNNALRDQFAVTQIPTQNLISANVIGTPQFIPGLTSVEVLIIDKGSNDGVKKNDGVIYKNNLVGTVSTVSLGRSLVNLVTNKNSVFTAKTAKTNALGVIKGQGQEEMFLDNVVLSDKLQNGDLVLTKGSIDENGQGQLPQLIIGKIIAVNKKTSNIFQSADVKSLLDLERLSMVFVVKQ